MLCPLLRASTETITDITLDHHLVSRKHAVLLGGKAVSVVPLSTKMLIRSMLSMHFISRHKAFTWLIFPCDIIYTQQVFTVFKELQDYLICGKGLLLLIESYYYWWAACTSQSVMQTYSHDTSMPEYLSCLLCKKSCILFSFIRVACKKNFILKL